MGKLITRTIEFVCDACGTAAPPYSDGAEDEEDFEEDDEDDDGAADTGTASALPVFWGQFMLEMRQPNPEFAVFEERLNMAIDGVMTNETVPHARALRAKEGGPPISVEELNDMRDETRELILRQMGGYPAQHVVEKKAFVLCEKHVHLLAAAGVDVNLLLYPGVIAPWGGVGAVDPLDVEGPDGGVMEAPIDFASMLAAQEAASGQPPVIVEPPAGGELPNAG